MRENPAAACSLTVTLGTIINCGRVTPTAPGAVLVAQPDSSDMAIAAAFAASRLANPFPLWFKTRPPGFSTEVPSVGLWITMPQPQT